MMSLLSLSEKTTRVETNGIWAAADCCVSTDVLCIKPHAADDY